jgi:hypothetical protein
MDKTAKFLYSITEADPGLKFGYGFIRILKNLKRE